MKEDTKILIVAFVLPLLLTIFFKNIVNKPQDVVSIYSIPILLWIGYISGKGGAKAWIGVTLFITLGYAVLYGFF
ncbi:MAG: hypothetical protein OIN88_12225 [Candidatus Methanoperedens sp.]|nr:hypothetical protein [Candidatus Methanoperedens sp.]MCZ7360048.1 hypothetical protein [Candidatus Methanoperedens sp.]HLB70528.1 hypothetical protein [Candidatus Methanoperedens sp.]